MTNNEDKLNAKEEELKKICDRFDQQKQEYDELANRYSQIMEDKNLLSEQLQAETELCAEAEEVGGATVLSHSVWNGKTLTEKKYVDGLDLILVELQNNQFLSQ